MEATIQKNKKENRFEVAEWKILIVGRIQSHFQIAGCDSIRRANLRAYSRLQCMRFIPFWPHDNQQRSDSQRPQPRRKTNGMACPKCLF